MSEDQAWAEVERYRLAADYHLKRLQVWRAVAIGLIVLVVVGVIAAVIVSQRGEQTAQEQREHRMFCDLAHGYGTDRYWDCIDRGS